MTAQKNGPPGKLALKPGQGGVIICATDDKTTQRRKARMPKSKKKIKVRDQKPLKEVKGGGRHHHRRGIRASVALARDDPPAIRHL